MKLVTGETYASITICPHVAIWTEPDVAERAFMVRCGECGQIEWPGSKWAEPEPAVLK